MFKKKSSRGKKFLNSIVAVLFLFHWILPDMGLAQALNLPAPGTMLALTPAFAPPLLKGIQIYPDNPLQFDFIVHGGDHGLKGQALKPQAETLIRYFLASLTVPKEDLWVNLSPYEQDRIMKDALASTDLGRDLLAQDYILKQITSSLLYPEDELGKTFWENVYKKSFEKFGTTEVPIDTFHKIWIVPDKAVIYEHGNAAFVAQATLKVVLEQDYIAAQENRRGNTEERKGNSSTAKKSLDSSDIAYPASSTSTLTSNISTSILRDIVIPEITREVNHGQHFAPLRQIYHSVILSAWFKQALRESLVAQVYADQNKVKGIEIKQGDVKQEVYQRYLEAFKTGVYNYIKVEYDNNLNRNIPRKYFSGGSHLDVTPVIVKDVREILPLLPGVVALAEETSFVVALEGPFESPMRTYQAAMLELRGDPSQKENLDHAMVVSETEQRLFSLIDEFLKLILFTDQTQQQVFEKIGKSPIIIYEMFRDAIQNTPKFNELTTDEKINLVEKILDAYQGTPYVEQQGATKIKFEIGSLVNPKVIAVMEDIPVLARHIYENRDRWPNIKFSMLMFSQKHVERALEIFPDIDELTVNLAASEKYSLKNVKSIPEEYFDKYLKPALVRIQEINLERQKQGKAKIRTTCYISNVWGYADQEGKDHVSVNKLINLIKKVQEYGVTEILLSDTTGEATPKSVVTRLKKILQEPELKGIKKWGVHFHSETISGHLNVFAAIFAGVEDINVSMGSLGGSPFAQEGKAPGNTSTGDFLFFLDVLGQIPMSVDLDEIYKVIREMEHRLDDDFVARATLGIHRLSTEERMKLRAKARQRLGLDEYQPTLRFLSKETSAKEVAQRIFDEFPDLNVTNFEIEEGLVRVEFKNDGITARATREENLWRIIWQKADAEADTPDKDQDFAMKAGEGKLGPAANRYQQMIAGLPLGPTSFKSKRSRRPGSSYSFEEILPELQMIAKGRGKNNDRIYINGQQTIEVPNADLLIEQLQDLQDHYNNADQKERSSIKLGAKQALKEFIESLNPQRDSSDSAVKDNAMVVNSMQEIILSIQGKVPRGNTSYEISFSDLLPQVNSFRISKATGNAVNLFLDVKGFALIEKPKTSIKPLKAFEREIRKLQEKFDGQIEEKDRKATRQEAALALEEFLLSILTPRPLIRQYLFKNDIMLDIQKILILQKRQKDSDIFTFEVHDQHGLWISVPINDSQTAFRFIDELSFLNQDFLKQESDNKHILDQVQNLISTVKSHPDTDSAMVVATSIKELTFDEFYDQIFEIFSQFETIFVGGTLNLWFNFEKDDFQVWQFKKDNFKEVWEHIQQGNMLSSISISVDSDYEIGINLRKFRDENDSFLNFTGSLGEEIQQTIENMFADLSRGNIFRLKEFELFKAQGELSDYYLRIYPERVELWREGVTRPLLNQNMIISFENTTPDYMYKILEFLVYRFSGKKEKTESITPQTRLVAPVKIEPDTEEISLNSVARFNLYDIVSGIQQQAGNKIKKVMIIFEKKQQPEEFSPEMLIALNQIGLSDIHSIRIHFPRNIRVELTQVMRRGNPTIKIKGIHNVKKNIFLSNTTEALKHKRIAHEVLLNLKEDPLRDTLGMAKEAALDKETLEPSKEVPATLLQEQVVMPKEGASASDGWKAERTDVLNIIDFFKRQMAYFTGTNTMGLSFGYDYRTEKPTFSQDVQIVTFSETMSLSSYLARLRAGEEFVIQEIVFDFIINGNKSKLVMGFLNDDYRSVRIDAKGQSLNDRLIIGLLAKYLIRRHMNNNLLMDREQNAVIDHVKDFVKVFQKQANKKVEKFEIIDNPSKKKSTSEQPKSLDIGDRLILHLQDGASVLIRLPMFLTRNAIDSDIDYHARLDSEQGYPQDQYKIVKVNGFEPDEEGIILEKVVDILLRQEHLDQKAIQEDDKVDAPKESREEQAQELTPLEMKLFLHNRTYRDILKIIYEESKFYFPDLEFESFEDFFKSNVDQGSLDRPYEANHLSFSIIGFDDEFNAKVTLTGNVYITLGWEQKTQIRVEFSVKPVQESHQTFQRQHRGHIRKLIDTGRDRDEADKIEELRNELERTAEDFSIALSQRIKKESTQVSLGSLVLTVYEMVRDVFDDEDTDVQSLQDIVIVSGEESYSYREFMRLGRIIKLRDKIEILLDSRYSGKRKLEVYFFDDGIYPYADTYYDTVANLKKLLKEIFNPEWFSGDRISDPVEMNVRFSGELDLADFESRLDLLLPTKGLRSTDSSARLIGKLKPHAKEFVNMGIDGLRRTFYLRHHGSIIEIANISISDPTGQALFSAIVEVLTEMSQAQEGFSVGDILPSGLHEPQKPDTDSAMVVNPGGIDLSESQIDLQIRRDANGIALPVSQQDIENIYIEGFIPVIINIQPVTNLLYLLGLVDEEGNIDSAFEDIDEDSPLAVFFKEQRQVKQSVALQMSYHSN